MSRSLALLAGLVPCAAAAQVTLAQHKSTHTASGVNTVSFAFDAATQPGALLIVVGGWSGAGITTNPPTDSQGNTYVRVAEGGAATSQLVDLYYAERTAGGSIPTVTWTVNGGNTPLSIAIAEFDGVQGYTGLMSSAQSVGGGSTTPAAGAIAGVAPGSLVVGALSHDGNVTSDAGSGFHLLDVCTDNSTNFNPAADEYLVTGSLSIGSVDATFALSASDDWAAIGAVFSASDAGAADAGSADGGAADAGMPDAGSVDAGPTSDAGPPDAGLDAGRHFGEDGSVIGSPDAGANLPEFGFGCGCTSPGGALLGVALLVAALGARRRKGSGR